MSLEGVTDAVATAFTTVPGMKAVYSSTATEPTSGVQPILDDIPDTPVAMVRHGGFELKPGSFEVINHQVIADLFFEAVDPGLAEKLMLPMVSLCIATFRNYAGLSPTLSAAGIIVAAIRRGGPSVDALVNTKTYLIWPLVVEVTEAGPQQYQLTP